jgi:hypothetical protein
MQTTDEGGEDTPLLVSHAEALLVIDRWRADQPSTFDRVLRGMIAAGVVQDAICSLFLLTIEALRYHLLRLDLPAPLDRPMRKSGKHPWTVEETRLLIVLWTANMRAEAIGAILRRSAGSVRSKARRLGLYRRMRRDLVNAVSLGGDIMERSGRPASVESVIDPTPEVSLELSTSSVSTSSPAAAAATVEVAVPAAAVDATAAIAIVEPTTPETGGAVNVVVGGKAPAGKPTGHHRIKWTDERSESVARRWYAWQSRFGIAEDLGMTEPQVRSQASVLGLPPRDPKKIVPDYVEGRPYDTSLEESMVKRRCILDHRVFWGKRHGPHTSPRAMKTKRYEQLRSGMDQAYCTVNVE